MLFTISLLFAGVVASAGEAQGLPIDPGGAPPEEEPYVASVSELCARGRDLLNHGESGPLLEAADLYAIAVEKYPDSGCGHSGRSWSLASLYMRGLEPDDVLITQSLESARQGASLEPSSPFAMASLARALYLDLQPHEAERDVEKAYALDSESIPALQTSALIRLSARDLDGAGDAIGKALTLSPGLPASHMMMGNVHLVARRYAEAMISFRKALALAPGYATATMQLAAALEGSGDYDNSAWLLDEVVSQNEHLKARAHVFIAHSLMKRGLWDNALEVLRKADFGTRRRFGDGTVLYLEGVCYEQLGRAEEAAAAFRSVIDDYPDATAGFGTSDRLAFTCYEGLGRMHLEAVEYEKAAAVMKEGVERSGASLDLYLRLARLYEEYRLLDRAAALLEQAVDRRVVPRHAPAHLDAYVMWARLSLKRSDTEALDRLGASLESRTEGLEGLDDFVTDLMVMRAMALAGRGDKALAWLHHAVDLGYQHLAWIDEDPELASMRSLEGYLDLVKTAPEPLPGR